MKYSIDAFTEGSVGSQFPENSWDANSIEEVSDIIKNCSRQIAGIAQVQVWITNQLIPKEQNE